LNRASFISKYPPVPPSQPEANPPVYKVSTAQAPPNGKLMPPERLANKNLLSFKVNSRRAQYKSQLQAKDQRWKRVVRT
jgi:hypothetical protein